MYKSNWEILETNQKLFNDALMEMQNEGIDLDDIDLKDIVQWVNEKPYPYKNWSPSSKS